MSIDALLERDMDQAARHTKQKKILDLLTRGLDANDSRVQELFSTISNVDEAQLDKTLRSLNGNVYSGNDLATIGTMNAVSAVLANLRNGPSIGGMNSASPVVRSYAEQRQPTEAEDTLSQFVGDHKQATGEGYWSGWMKLLVGRGFYEGSQGSSDTDTSSAGYLGGAFYTIDEGKTLGFFGGYTTSLASREPTARALPVGTSVSTDSMIWPVSTSPALLNIPRKISTPNALSHSALLP